MLRRKHNSRLGPGLALLVLAGCSTPATTAQVTLTPVPSAPIGSTSAVGPTTHTAHTGDAGVGAPAAPDAEAAEVIDDEPGADPSLETGATAQDASAPHPLDGWSEDRIAAAAGTDIESLGALSLGRPSGGTLINGVRAEASELFVPVAADHVWGTPETLAYLTTAIRRVHERFPGTAPLSLGHISAKHGGPLRPHRSHQSGRDVDLSFYYGVGGRWYARGTRENLDLPRTWALVRALIIETDVEMILVDHSIQRLLKEHALDIGEDAGWVEALFRGVPGKLPPIIRHAPGHATHLHIRFFNPVAQESARRCHAALAKAGKVREMQAFLRYRAKPGDTLGKIAKKFGTSVQALKAANGLRTSHIREHRDYRIPIRGRQLRASDVPVRVPPRRLPPMSVVQGPRSSGSRAASADVGPSAFQ